MYGCAVDAVTTAGSAAGRLAEAKRRFTRGLSCAHADGSAAETRRGVTAADGVTPPANAGVAVASATQIGMSVSSGRGLPPAAPCAARERDSRAKGRDAVQTSHDGMRGNGDTPLPAASGANHRPGSERSRLSATPNSCIIDNLSGILPPNSQNTINVLHSPLETIVPPMLVAATYDDGGSSRKDTRGIITTAARTLLPSRHSSADDVLDGTPLNHRARLVPRDTGTGRRCRAVPACYRDALHEHCVLRDAMPRTRRAGARKGASRRTVRGVVDAPRREGLLQLLQSYRACLDAVARFSLTTVTPPAPPIADKFLVQEWHPRQADVAGDGTQRRQQHHPSLPTDPYTQAVRNALSLLARLQVYRHSLQGDIVCTARGAGRGAVVTPSAQLPLACALPSGAPTMRDEERQHDGAPAEAALRAAQERAEQLLYYNTIARSGAGLQRLVTARQMYVSMLRGAGGQNRAAGVTQPTRETKADVPSMPARVPAPETRAQALPLPLAPTVRTAQDGAGGSEGDGDNGNNDKGSSGGSSSGGEEVAVVHARRGVRGETGRGETRTGSALLPSNRTSHTLPYHSNNSSVTMTSTVIEQPGTATESEGRQGGALRATFTAVPPTPLRPEAVAASETISAARDDAATPDLAPPPSSPSGAGSTIDTTLGEQRALRLLTRVRALRRQTEDMTVALLHTCGAWGCWEGTDSSRATPPPLSSAVPRQLDRRGMIALRALFSDLFVTVPRSATLGGAAKTPLPLAHLPAAPPLSTQFELFARFNDRLRHEMLQAVAHQSPWHASDARRGVAHGAAQDWPLACPHDVVAQPVSQRVHELRADYANSLAWRSGQALRQLCAVRRGNTAATQYSQTQAMTNTVGKHVADITAGSRSSSGSSTSSTDTSYGDVSSTYDSGDSSSSDSRGDSESVTPASRAPVLQRAGWPLRAAAWQPLVQEMTTARPALAEARDEPRTGEGTTAAELATQMSSATPNAASDAAGGGEPASRQHPQTPRRSSRMTRRRRSVGDATPPVMFHPMQTRTLSARVAETEDAQGLASRSASLSSRHSTILARHATRVTASELAVRPRRHHHHHGDAAVGAKSAQPATPPQPKVVPHAGADMSESALSLPRGGASVAATAPPIVVPLQSTEVRGAKRGILARLFHTRHRRRTSPHLAPASTSPKRRRNPLAALFSLLLGILGMLLTLQYIRYEQRQQSQRRAPRCTAAARPCSATQNTLIEACCVPLALPRPSSFGSVTAQVNISHDTAQADDGGLSAGSPPAATAGLTELPKPLTMPRELPIIAPQTVTAASGAVAASCDTVQASDMLARALTNACQETASASGALEEAATQWRTQHDASHARDATAAQDQDTRVHMPHVPAASRGRRLSTDSLIAARTRHGLLDLGLAQ